MTRLEADGRYDNLWESWVGRMKSTRQRRRGFRNSDPAVALQQRGLPQQVVWLLRQGETRAIPLSR